MRLGGKLIVHGHGRDTSITPLWWHSHMESQSSSMMGCQNAQG